MLLPKGTPVVCHNQQGQELTGVVQKVSGIGYSVLVDGDRRRLFPLDAVTVYDGY